MKLYAHPFSSYCQKVLIALYENDTPFEFAHARAGRPEPIAELAALWPLKRMPVLRRRRPHGGRGEHHHRAPRPPPSRPGAAASRTIRARALDVRMMDRFFDNYVMTPMQKIVVRRDPRPRTTRPARRRRRARTCSTPPTRWLDDALRGREWAAGDAFSLADCAAAPSLFYADWVHPIDPRSRTCSPTAGGCSRGRRSRAPSTRRGPIARSSRSARPTATEEAQAVEFWFEFASTYSYPGRDAHRALARAAGGRASRGGRSCSVRSSARRAGTTRRSTSIPAKGRYMWRDLERICAALGAAAAAPVAVSAQRPARGARRAAASASEPWLPAFVRAVYRANFAEDRDIADAGVIAASCSTRSGSRPRRLARRRARGREQGRAARADRGRATRLGIFGAPSFVVGGELFWGNDRLEDALAWCAKG